MSQYTKLYLTVLMAFAAGSAAFAQDLNPEVHVTNDYQTRIAEVHKSGLPMAVPDSLTKFSTAIDYSVFATDYKGAYDFSPYFIAVTPEPTPFVGNELYLKAGAGYGFHPTLRLVYTPLQRGLVRTEGHISLDGYSGNYSSLDSRANYKGHDYSLISGATLNWDKEAFTLSSGLNYKGIYTKDDILNSNFHTVELEGNIHGNADYTPLNYEADAKLFYSYDALSLSPSNLGEFGFNAGGNISALHSGSFCLRTYARVNGSFYSKNYQRLFVGTLAPLASFSWTKVKLSFGPKLAYGSKFSIYPELHASTMLGNREVKLSLDVTGGPKVLGYTAIKNQDHWFNPSYLGAFAISEEKVKASLALEGSALKHLQYVLEGGYVVRENHPIYALTASSALLVPSIVYANFRQVYAHMLLAWESRSFSANADLSYRHITKVTKVASSDILSLPAFCAELSAMYNIGGRVWLGANINAQSSRSCVALNVPGFVDLSLYGEYGLGKSFALWAKLGNLLNQRIAYSPTHIAGGIYFSAGITLKLLNRN